MKRPAWAAAPGFAACWAALELGVKRAYVDLRPTYSSILTGMRRARVVAIGSDQVSALPRLCPDDYQGLTPYISSTRLPFDPLFLDLDGVSMAPYIKNCELVGVLIGRPAPTSEFPFVFPFIRRPGGVTGWPGASITVHDGQVVVNEHIYISEHMDGGQWQEEQGCLWDCAERAMAVLSWLESVNVDLGEPELTKSQRARAKRKGQAVALTVKVRSPKSKSVKRGGSRNYSHRFEVAGHYMHFPEGTKVADADPTKLSFVPGRGFVRKVWCPPHVKGPEDKPLIPKVRVVEHVT